MSDEQPIEGTHADPLVTLLKQLMQFPPKTVERRDAAGELYVLVEDRMREIASRLMRKERSGHTWHTTLLADSAFQKLVLEEEQDRGDDSDQHDRRRVKFVLGPLVIHHQTFSNARDSTMRGSFSGRRARPPRV